MPPGEPSVKPLSATGLPVTSVWMVTMVPAGRFRSAVQKKAVSLVMPPNSAAPALRSRSVNSTCVPPFTAFSNTKA
jgi:hypothetical protein